MCVAGLVSPCLSLIVFRQDRGHRLVEDPGGQASGAECQEGVVHLSQHVGRVGSGQRPAPAGWEAETKELF